MRDWAMMLGGLLVWALHFLAVYGLASVADISDPSLETVWRITGLAVTLVCILTLAGIARGIGRKSDASPLSRHLGLAGSAIGAIAVVWQSLPLIVS